VRGPSSMTAPLALLALVGAGLVWSGIGPYDRTTWWLEVLPVLLALPVLAFTARRFPLTPLVYTLIAIHCLILVLGGHYTYARVPLGFWVQDWFDFSRNHYDRIGHLMQGFGPAMIARELLLRTSPLKPGKWLFALVTLGVLGVSAFYEFTEWWAALAGGEAADAFLGTQGDPWDTQWDMFLAFCGAVAAQVLLSRLHDRQLAALEDRPAAAPYRPVLGE
jgi:putative membrane protein